MGLKTYFLIVLFLSLFFTASGTFLEGLGENYDVSVSGVNASYFDDLNNIVNKSNSEVSKISSNPSSILLFSWSSLPTVVLQFFKVGDYLIEILQTIINELALNGLAIPQYVIIFVSVLLVSGVIMSVVKLVTGGGF